MAIINKKVTTQAQTQFHVGTDGNLVMTATSDGNVGIGTDPGAKLDVLSSTALIAQFARNGSATYDFTITDGGNGVAQLYINAQTTNTGYNIRPKNSSGTNIDALFIDPEGHIGIGTTTPSSGSSSLTTLNVSGAIMTLGSSNANTRHYMYEQRYSGSNNLTMGYIANGSTHTAGFVSSQNNLPLHVGVGNVDNIIMNSSGHVTTPSQPHILFSPRYSGGSGFANTHNENTSYSRGTLSTTVVGGYARITVPVAGLYLVTFNSICDTSTGRKDTAIAVNGSNVVTGLSEDNGQGFHYRSHAVTLDLAANDYLTFSNDDWYDAASNSYTTWRNVSVTLIG